MLVALPALVAGFAQRSKIALAVALVVVPLGFLLLGVLMAWKPDSTMNVNPSRLITVAVPLCGRISFASAVTMTAALAFSLRATLRAKAAHTSPPLVCVGPISGGRLIRFAAFF